MSEPKKKNTLVHDALVLFAITLIAAVALGFIYELTKEPIAQAQINAQNEAYRAVCPELVSTKEWSGSIADAQALIDADSELTATTVEQIILGVDAQGSTAGYIMIISNAKGYGGTIEAVVGIAPDGTLSGLEFLEIGETAGLGMKAKEDAFRSQFNGTKTSRFSLAKRGISGETEVDAISSATVTTAAVTRIVDAALEIFAEIGGAD